MKKQQVCPVEGLSLSTQLIIDLPLWKITFFGIVLGASSALTTFLCLLALMP